MLLVCVVGVVPLGGVRVIFVVVCCGWFALEACRTLEFRMFFVKVLLLPGRSRVTIAAALILLGGGCSPFR